MGTNGVGVLADGQAVHTTKPAWTSKTLWANLILAILGFVPGASEWYAAHPDMVVTMFAVVNVILRFITKDKIQIS